MVPISLEYHVFAPGDDDLGSMERRGVVEFGISRRLR